MIVFCYGMLKSGSTLAFELCKAVLEAGGHWQRRLPDSVVRAGHAANFIGRPSVQQLRELLDAVAKDEIVAVKLHAPLPDETRAAFLAAQARGEVRLHVNFRDPREICLSLLDAGSKARARDGEAAGGFGPIRHLEQAAAFIDQQIAHCRSWGAIPGALHLHYNDVAFATGQVIERMSANLGLTGLNPERVAALRDQILNSEATLKNRAVIHRHRQELDEARSEFLLDAIPEAREFVQQVCERRDYGWFARG